MSRTIMVALATFGAVAMPADAQRPEFAAKVTVERQPRGADAKVTHRGVDAVRVDRKGAVLFELRARQVPGDPLRKGDRVVEADGTVWVVDSDLANAVDGRAVVRVRKAN